MHNKPVKPMLIRVFYKSKVITAHGFTCKALGNNTNEKDNINIAYDARVYIGSGTENSSRRNRQ